MQVQPVTKTEQLNNKQISHKGAADITLRYLATNQAIGANLVDLSFMAQSYQEYRRAQKVFKEEFKDVKIIDIEEK